MVLARLIAGLAFPLAILAAAAAHAGPELLLVDNDGDRILAYDVATGAFLGVSATEDSSHFDTPMGVTRLDPWVYVTASTNQRIVRYEIGNPTNHEVLLTFPSPAFPGLSNPWGMAAGPDGRIYVSVEGPPTDGIGILLVFDPALGTFEVYADFPGTVPGTSGDGLVRPVDLVFGADGHLYVTNRRSLGTPSKPGQNILRFEGPLGADPGAPMPAAGKTGALYASLDGQPTGLTFGPDHDGDGADDLYVSHNRSGDRLAVVSGPLGTSPGTHRGAFLATGVNSPAGLGFFDGELLLSAFSDDELRVYDASGVFQRVLAPTGDEPPDPLTGLPLKRPLFFVLAPLAQPVPSLTPPALALLAVVLLACGAYPIRRARRGSRTNRAVT